MRLPSNLRCIRKSSKGRLAGIIFHGNDVLVEVRPAVVVDRYRHAAPGPPSERLFAGMVVAVESDVLVQPQINGGISARQGDALAAARCGEIRAHIEESSGRRTDLESLPCAEGDYANRAPPRSAPVRFDGDDPSDLRLHGFARTRFGQPVHAWPRPL